MLVTITILLIKYPEKVIMVYGCKGDHCYLVLYGGLKPSKAMVYEGVWVSIIILVVYMMLFGTTAISMVCVILKVTIGLHLYFYYCWFYYLNRTFVRIWCRTFLQVDKCLSVTFCVYWEIVCISLFWVK